MNELKVKYMNISELIPYENNPRINTNAIDKVAKSIEKFGFQQPIVVDKNNVIVVGHTRLEASKKLGLKQVPVVHADELTEEQAKAYRLADNKTNEFSEWDFDLLEQELGELSIDMSEFGFDDIENEVSEWFNRENRSDTSRQTDNDEYNEFLDKFETKKTTDDCYTPEIIYDAVAEWVATEYKVDRKNFVRPFYPNGDYKQEKYKSTDIVVDNPPFSILSEILKFYDDNKIKFFLFAPTLTLFSSSSSCCALPVGVTITYENGANVDTSFLTNLEMDNRLRSAPTLYTSVKDANKENLKELKKELPKYEYCDYIITSTRVGQFSRYGIEFEVPREESKHIRQLECQKESGKVIFGSGYIVSERIKAEKEKAEKEKAEKEKVEKWELSEKELEIVKSLKRR